MPTKPQQALQYRQLIKLLRGMREEAGLTQRDLAVAVKKTQPWVHNCETANRRVDMYEFALWCKACGVDPITGYRRFLREIKML